MGTTGRMFARGGLCADHNSPVESGTDCCWRNSGNKVSGQVNWEGTHSVQR